MSSCDIILGILLGAIFVAFTWGVCWLCYYAGYGYEAHKRHKREMKED